MVTRSSAPPKKVKTAIGYSRNKRHLTSPVFRNSTAKWVGPWLTLRWEERRVGKECCR